MAVHRFAKDDYSILPTVADDEWMGTFHIYVDEAGKIGYPQTEFTTLCGFVGRFDEWQHVSDEWTKVWFKWQCPPVHMARIMNPDKKADGWKILKDEAGKFWQDKRDAMLVEFASVISRSALVCVGLVVDANAYREALTNPDCHLGQSDPNVFAFHQVIMRGIERVETVDKHSPISIILDDDPSHIKAYYDLLKGLKDIPNPKFDKVRQRIKAISFCQDDVYAGLQAADMVAYEARNHMRALATDSGHEPSRLLYHLTHGGMHQPNYMNGEAVIALGRNIRKALQAESELNDD